MPPAAALSPAAPVRRIPIPACADRAGVHPLAAAPEEPPGADRGEGPPADRGAREAVICTEHRTALCVELLGRVQEPDAALLQKGVEEEVAPGVGRAA